MGIFDLWVCEPEWKQPAPRQIIATKEKAFSSRFDLSMIVIMIVFGCVFISLGALQSLRDSAGRMIVRRTIEPQLSKVLSVDESVGARYRLYVSAKIADPDAPQRPIEITDTADSELGGKITKLKVGDRATLRRSMGLLVVDEIYSDDWYPTSFLLFYLLGYLPWLWILRKSKLQERRWRRLASVGIACPARVLERAVCSAGTSNINKPPVKWLEVKVEMMSESRIIQPEKWLMMPHMEFYVGDILTVVADPLDETDFEASVSLPFGPKSWSSSEAG